MKQLILMELLSKLKANPKLMKKVKIFAVIGVVGFLMTGVLVIWAGFSALSYVSSKANIVMQSPQTTTHIENLKNEVKELSALQPMNCWGKIQSLMAIEPWLERPALVNLMNLKDACIEAKPKVCQGSDCK
jgi:hypothetical protein